MAHQPSVIEHETVDASIRIIKRGNRVTLAIQSGNILEVKQYTNSDWYERRLAVYQSGRELVLHVGPAAPGLDDTERWIWINEQRVSTEFGGDGWVSYGMCKHLLTPVWETIS